jgi:hypothetical protein
MRIAFDLEARKLVSWNLAALAAQTVRRRDMVPIELKAVKGAEGLAFPTDVAIYAVVKSAANGPGGAVLALANTFIASGTGANAVYTLSLNLNTSGINDLFAAEAKEVACVFEIEVVSAQFRLTSEPVAWTVQNDYSRANDTPPTELPDTKATQAEAEAGSDNTKWMTPLRTAQAIAALGGASGLPDYEIKTANFTAEAGKAYAVATSGGAITATLPDVAPNGSAFVFADADADGGGWGVNHLTLAAGARKLNGVTGGTFVCSDDNTRVEVVFVNSTVGYTVVTGQLPAVIGATIVPRIDTALAINAITLAAGELATTSDHKELRVGTGSAAGGKLLAGETYFFEAGLTVGTRPTMTDAVAFYPFKTLQWAAEAGRWYSVVALFSFAPVGTSAGFNLTLRPLNGAGSFFAQSADGYDDGGAKIYGLFDADGQVAVSNADMVTDISGIVSVSICGIYAPLNGRQVGRPSITPAFSDVAYKLAGAKMWITPLPTNYQSVSW